MIGDAKTEIVTGCEWLTERTLNALAPVKLKDEAQTALDRLQEGLRNGLVKLRKEERNQKELLEVKKNKIMDGTLALPQTCKSKHEYLFKDYVETLRGIGLSLGRLRLKHGELKQALSEKLDSKWGLSVEKVEINMEHEVIATLKKGSLASPVPLMRLLIGTSGFRLKDSTPPRPVYEKQVLDDPDFKKGLNEYVQDDAGLMTRRYAYAEKPKTVINLLMNDEIASMQGRFLRSNASDLRGPAEVTINSKTIQAYIRDEDYQKDQQQPQAKRKFSKFAALVKPNQVSATTKGGYIEVTDEKGKKVQYEGVDVYQKTQGPSRYKLGSKKNQPMTQEELLFINQELGSGPHQRGICLSSTPKLIHGNQGDTFRSDETVLVLIDLSTVPTGERRLYNLYSQEAQTKTIGLTDTKAKGRDMKHHTDTSTAKNREVFLLELKKEYIVGIANDTNREHMQSPDAYVQTI